jgi:hypothetical protein
MEGLKFAHRGNGSSPGSRRREDKNAVNVYLGAADRGKVYRGDLPGRTPAPSI